MGRKTKFIPNFRNQYVQDHHKSVVYGGSVSENAPFGTSKVDVYYKKY